MLALVEDRTRERRVEAIRRDFVANVSHELKTPVGAIRLLAEAVAGRRRRPGGGRAVRRPDADRERPADPAGAADHRAVPAAGRRPARGAGRRSHVDDVIATAVDDQRDRRRGQAASRSSHGGEHGPGGLRQRGAGRAPRSPTWSPTRSPTPARRRPVLVVDQGRRRRWSRSRSTDQGIGIPAERDRPDLRAVLPGRPGPAPLHRRHRPRAVDRQARRGHPRRRRSGCGPSRARARRSPCRCPRASQEVQT